jgi:hypothetical protein
VFLLAKVLQAIGFADVGYGLYLGVARGDMWQELWMTLTGVGCFYAGRLLERWG